MTFKTVPRKLPEGKYPPKFDPTGTWNEQDQVQGPLWQKVTPEAHKFLTSYAVHGSVPRACADAGVTFRTYTWWSKGTNFKMNLDLAKQMVAARLEAIAFEAAAKDKGVLLKQMLEAHDPETYSTKPGAKAAKFKEQKVRLTRGPARVLEDDDRTFDDPNAAEPGAAPSEETGPQAVSDGAGSSG